MIVEIVNANAKTTVAELCRRFSVSPATVRNDLGELENAGLLKRTHGGAISNKRANFEPNAYQKEVERVVQKRAIARLAVAYVNEGDTIALDTGTTTFELAKLLVGYRSLTVVTNDLQIAMFLECGSNANVVLAGGAVRRNFHCTAGQKAINTIADLNVDRTFLAANGVSIERGITTPNVETAYVKEKLVALAGEVVLLADSTKINKVSFARYADMRQMGVLITDGGADQEYLEKIRRLDVIVRVCDG
ncbi:MAG: DeoR/GlpR family DNA-binding transcription regulator [Clostridia bacterium]|nr:DeoR/GlpR family DNA-binding transcription regulator [Clostridia bacterium]